MDDFLRMKNEIPKLKLSEIAKRLSYSSSTLQRYKHDMKMVSPYRIQPNNTNKPTKKTSSTNFDTNSHREPDVKRPQMTSNDLKTIQTNTKPTRKNTIILKAGSVHENVELNELYLDENLLKRDLQLGLAMPILSNGNSVGSDTVQVLKNINSQFLSTQKRRTISFYDACYQKNF